ncbi:MAG: glycosyl hydrolase family 18 protein [Bacillota bacterium]|jgi:spore germination protein|nr:glycosyl hydrolase family 18 protein [Bacillota bacterium]NLU54868.1 hypothetical protein [Bacillota bacterium]HPT61978.1 glycosyl hydrolase family 18 protein [Bacillota bacterium]
MLILPWMVPGIQNSFDALVAARKRLERVSPTMFTIDGDFTIQEAHDPNLEKVREMGLKVFPLVANKGFDAEVAGRLLKTEESRRKTAEILTEKVLEGGYPGLNVDFEGTFGDFRNEYSWFISVLSEMLHAHGKELSVDVVALAQDPTPNYSWGYPFDYRKLGPEVDYLVLMGYDYSHTNSPPGPVSPLFWLEQVVRYATSIVPREKVVLGLPFYGRHWTTNSRGEHSAGRGVTYEQAMAFADKWQVEPVLHEHGCMYLRKEHEDGSVEEIYFENKDTLLKKINLAEGLAGVAFWRLGQEDPRIWEYL